MKFSIRFANLEDIDAVILLERQCFSDAWKREAFLCELEVSHFVVVECEIDDKKTIVGYCIYTIICDFAELLNIAICPQFRRKGLAKMLINHFLSCAQRSGANQFFLEVRTTNQNAINLYTDFGFKVMSVRKAYYEDGADAFVMSKSSAL